MPNRMAIFLVKDVANLKIKICPSATNTGADQ